MRVSLKDVKVGLRNSEVRIPFRYANSCLTRCPQAVVAVMIEAEGQTQVGYSGDCLPPGWFDKTPGKTFEQQIDEMLKSLRNATDNFQEELSEPKTLFDAWWACYHRQHEWAEAEQLSPLVATFGVSFLERAVMDAVARKADVSFDEAVRNDLFGVRPELVHQELAGYTPQQWLPASPKQSLYVRHTVGLTDPLTEADIPADEKLDDGWPQALEQYVSSTGTAYFKVKVANQLETDLGRVKAIAQIVERQRGAAYQVTLDGNEQYKSPEEFDELVDAIRGCVELNQFWMNVLAIEQPLDRAIALEPECTEGIGILSESKPVIIDESDGRLGDYATALECGYRGVSSKSCKGPIKSLLNAGLTWRRNQQAGKEQYIMTGEDLCSVGIVPVQSDLCLVATMGLDHVERNGHHFHPGLSYLPVTQQERALEMHPDFYTRCGKSVAPQIQEGKFEIGSLQCAGFGFAVEPALTDYVPADEWKFSTLGLG